MPGKRVRLVGMAMIALQDATLARKAVKWPPDAPIDLPDAATPRLLRYVRALSDATASGEQDDIIAAVATLVTAYRAFVAQTAMPELPDAALGSATSFAKATPLALEKSGSGDAA